MRRTIGLAAAGVIGGAVLRRRHNSVDVPSSLPGAGEHVVRAGDVDVTVYTSGPAVDPPILLVHSVNAAASAAEMRPLFTRLGAHRRTVALDLPGYGRSSRPPVTYSPADMTAAVVAVLDELDGPADVVGLSLGCEFVARAAIERPGRVRSVVLLSPTGMQSDQDRAFAVPALGDVIRAPIVGEALFGALASRPSINYFLGKSFVDEVDPTLAEHALRTARHPDARYAPASFLEGRLFTRHAVRELYEPLSQLTLVIADQDPYTDFGALPGLLGAKPTWRHRRIAPHRGLPQFDHADAVADAVLWFSED